MEIRLLFLRHESSQVNKVLFMRVLVIGSGGREHAICCAISDSSLLDSLFALPGNVGISKVAVCVDISVDDVQGIRLFCVENEIGLVVVGPEVPLANGITDLLESEGIGVVGCDLYASQLESSKSFTKILCDDAAIKTASYEVFVTKNDAISYLNGVDKFPIVIKADGLAAGKGVIIAENREEAIEAIEAMFGGKFGCMEKIVVEEFLQGVEASFFAISDGNTFKILSSAGDHKRVGENDTGPNTGGMGTYSPSPYITEVIEKNIIDNILQPTFKYLRERGHSYKGIIFAGLMITPEKEVYLIEYNIRFGDPEAQSILSRLETDFLEICKGVVEGNLDQIDIKFSQKKAITLVLAANGYPGEYKKGTIICDIEGVSELPNVSVFHAGTNLKEGELVADGGRVLNITAVGESFNDAYRDVYEAANMVDWDDKYYRMDIAKAVLEV